MICCPHLALAIILDLYKSQMSAEEKQKVEDNWVKRWKPQTNVNTRPRALLTSYIEESGIPLEQLEEEMDWACWPIVDDHSL